ncbi:MAG TPA: ATP-binding protein [Chitinophagaceae bacterium]|nr:ATP-binding protein [Chitinophagaceae bacterium]
MINDLSNHTTKVLIVDDDEDDFFITSDLIRQIPDNHFKIDWCYNYNQALESIKSRGYDIYFVDYRLGIKTGLDLLKEANKFQCEEPIILLTGKGNKLIDVEAMQTGATDYLIKSELSIEKLERCIRYSLERANSLKKIKSNERKYRNIFEHSKDAVFIVDKNLVFQDMNEATTKLLGYTKDELQQMSIFDLLANKNLVDIFKKAVAGKEITDDPEVELLTKDKEIKNCIISITNEKDESEKLQFQGFVHDITNLKKAEKANLQIEKLAAAGRLVRTLAHEVRNPLNNINMSVEQLKNEVSEDLAFYLHIIYKNSNRINDLIKELLDFSKPSELTFEKKSLQSIIDKTIAQALDRIILKHVNLRLKYDSKPAFIRADENKLSIAFLNLLINAIEAMEAEKGKLVIEITNGDSIHIVNITDNGCGIAPENLSKLFEPYFTSKRNGVGLGLASTLNIIKSHKGNIEVHSKLNAGTTFSILFPTASYFEQQ